MAFILTSDLLLNIADIFFLKKYFTIFLFFLGYGEMVHSQIPGFSVATDLSIQRNFKKEQRYFAIGQTVQAQFHLNKKDAVYVSFIYYSNGKFDNTVTATAKSTTTTPDAIEYVNSGKMRTKQFSTGWKKYLKGSFDEEKKWNLYAYAGFGLMLGRIENTHSASIDTLLYNVPVRVGKANFKRLTFDLGLGVEYPLGGDFYLYGEGRAWIPASDYPSKYLFVNSNAPFMGMLSGGLRILF